jgi:hypothetical protein
MTEKELSIIKSDYFSALADYGIRHEDAVRQTEDHASMIDKKLDGVCVASSKISGQGLFAEEDIEKDSLICIARLADKRTIAGRYANHSPYNNAVFLFSGENIGLVAIRDIIKGEELTINYRDSISLQLKLPGKINNLVVSNDSISTFVNGRCFLSKEEGAVHDLLFSRDHISYLSIRERVLAFEAQIESFPQKEIPPRHEFIKGLYKREITFLAGTCATGRIHNNDHMDVMLSGEMIVASEDGFKSLKGPCFMTSTAGNKKAGYALTDVIWATYHPTMATTVEDVESEIFLKEFDHINIDNNGGL